MLVTTDVHVQIDLLQLSIICRFLGYYMCQNDVNIMVPHSSQVINPYEGANFYINCLV